MNREPSLARRLFDRIEPVHAVSYFAPEARTVFDEMGLRGFWTGYFAARSAPLGVVPAEIVTAAFYNFTPERVAKSLSGAWAVISPIDALRARERAATAALRRSGVDDEEARLAADLAMKAVSAAEVGGRILYAANRALDWPQDPVARLWHASTLMREHRGDGHVAVLTAVGLSGRECNVLHAAAQRVPEAMIKRSRDYDDAQWEFHRDALRRRGLLDAAGGLTDTGRELKQHIEDTTDALALAALAGIDDAEVEALFRVVTPIARKVVAAGDVPAATPMGLSRDDLDDDSAHLG